MRVSIQQAAANAFAAWLQDKLPTVPIISRWPSPDRAKPLQSISIITAGNRRDTPIDLRILSKTNVGEKQTKAVWQHTACSQPMQLDVWAQSDPARDDLLAQLDDLLHVDQASLASSFAPTPVGTGNLIAVADGWEECGTIADFNFEEPQLEHGSDDHGRSIYRASFRGEAYFMLTSTVTSPRQTVITFKQYLTESDNTDTDLRTSVVDEDT